MLKLQLAYLYPSEIRRLLETAGFVEISIRGGFDGREFTQDGQELVMEAARDAEPSSLAVFLIAELAENDTSPQKTALGGKELVEDEVEHLCRR